MADKTCVEKTAVRNKHTWTAVQEMRADGAGEISEHNGTKWMSLTGRRIMAFEYRHGRKCPLLPSYTRLVLHALMTSDCILRSFVADKFASSALTLLVGRHPARKNE